ncbi:pyrimidine utilization protein A [Dactylosporangium fulvum]|uniref:Pyrimidine utilization protein A n=1 Tax=Dactylosporangium fulvum TaxID=53359 RepID=A0ABY5VTH9_9ACTN|nr:pyrimidine utilization protein A [Dactylosporangium fulvum]UWP80389.1 pyrimidine utilization protein A [Dactylosporangium fulvum]
MDIGVFLPIANNGWFVSKTAPQYKPTFELNRRIVESAERHGLDFALSMVKLRGFGGETEFWDYALESFTLMAGLAAATERIKLFASTPVLALSPALAARMAVTIDSIAPGRFGINIVSGWQKAEYQQLDVWPGDEHYGRRYDYASEYVTILRELLETGRSSFQGDFFHFDDCQLQPLPSAPIPLVGAGQSRRGIEFCAQHGDFNFVNINGVNQPTSFAPLAERVTAAGVEAQRDIGVYVLVAIIAAETDEEAWARWRHIQGGVDVKALEGIGSQMSLDTVHRNQDTSSVKRALEVVEDTSSSVCGLLIGSYQSVASMLDEVAAVEGTAGIMVVFDDFLDGLDTFGKHIQPLMTCRADR